MIKFKNILSEVELDPGSIDSSPFKELTEKEITDVIYRLRNNMMDNIHSEGRLNLYYSGMRRLTANTTYDVILRDGDKMYGRELVIYDLPNIEDDDKKVEEIKRIDTEIYKNKPIPDSFYLAAIKHKEEFFG